MVGSFRVLVEDEVFENKDFEICFNKCSYEKCLSNKVYETGSKFFYSLHLVVRGSGYLVVGDSGTGAHKVNIKSGTLFIISPDKNYVYYPDSSNPWDYIWVDFTGKNISEMMSMCGFSDEKPYLRLDNTKFNSMFMQLLNTYNMSTFSLLECNMLFLTIIANLIEAKNSNGCIARRHISSKNLVREALIFINCNHKLDITLSDISENIGASKNYLVSLFTREINISPMKYLTLYRIAVACDLLSRTGKSIGDISTEVGFNDALYFSRCFSEIKGVSPREYRKSPSGDPWEFLKSANIDYR